MYMAAPTASRPRSGAAYLPRSSVREQSIGAGVAARVRWDRLGRTAMLLVLLAIVYLYASVGVRMLSTWRQSRHDGAAVAQLEREHRRLLREHGTLTGTGTLETDARRLGMMRAGEQSYVVGGLPDN